MQLRKTMASTNVIESAFSIVEQVCRNVKPGLCTARDAALPG
jgi:hypothetical protein